MLPIYDPAALETVSPMKRGQAEGLTSVLRSTLPGASARSRAARRATT